jgi:arginine deiminase
MSLHVDSDAGRLRQVVLHRPGAELGRLTPHTIRDLSFDGIVWAERARAEHDAFAQALRNRGVTVHYLADLLTDVLESPEARDWVLDRVVTDDVVGPTLVPPLRRLAEQADSERLADYLVGGILKSELAHVTTSGLRWELMNRDDFVLAPLPSHLFPRNPTTWIDGGVSINPPATPARLRESVHSRAVYAFHPTFAAEPFQIWYDGTDRPHPSAALDGADIHVLGNGVVLIGLGGRTTAIGVENLARSLLAGGGATKVIAVELPHSHPPMHLDTVMTMINGDTFVMYPYLEDAPRSWTVLPASTADDPHALDVIRNDDLLAAIGEALGVEKVRVLKTDEDIRAAQHEQWDDGNSFLVIEPGVIVSYERNVTTNAYLRQHDVEVVTVADSELARGSRGPRCMACPIERDPV